MRSHEEVNSWLELAMCSYKATSRVMWSLQYHSICTVGVAQMVFVVAKEQQLPLKQQYKAAYVSTFAFSIHYRAARARHADACVRTSNTHTAA